MLPQEFGNNWLGNRVQANRTGKWESEIYKKSVPPITGEKWIMN
jgi:hypothetical protein